MVGVPRIRGLAGEDFKASLASEDFRLKVYHPPS